MVVESTERRLPPAKQRARRDGQILDALEALLAETPLRDLGVEEIAETAGITRTRFYVYYRSKHDAYVAVLARLAAMILESYRAPGTWFDRDPQVRPRDALLETFRITSRIWWEHRAVFREASDLWNTFGDTANPWRALMAEFIQRIRASIERERERGLAPAGVPAEDLAEFLMWQTERMLFLRILDDREPDEAFAATMVEVWVRSIYLADDPAPV